MGAADSLKRVKRAANKRVYANEEFLAAIKQAHADGWSLRTIGNTASISHSRVLQIVRASKPGEYCDCAMKDPRGDGLCGYCLREIRG